MPKTNKQTRKCPMCGVVFTRESFFCSKFCLETSKERIDLNKCKTIKEKLYAIDHNKKLRELCEDETRRRNNVFEYVKNGMNYKTAVRRSLRDNADKNTDDIEELTEALDNIERQIINGSGDFDRLNQERILLNIKIESVKQRDHFKRNSSTR